MHLFFNGYGIVFNVVFIEHLKPSGVMHRLLIPQVYRFYLLRYIILDLSLLLFRLFQRIMLCFSLALLLLLLEDHFSEWDSRISFFFFRRSFIEIQIAPLESSWLLVRSSLLLQFGQNLSTTGSPDSFIILLRGFKKLTSFRGFYSFLFNKDYFIRLSC